MVLRAQMDYQGTAEVDAPISLKVVPQPVARRTEEKSTVKKN